MLFMKFYPRVRTFSHVAVLFGWVFAGCSTDMKKEGTSREKDKPAESGAVRHIEPDAETGFSLATVVGDVPLAFTNQLFPFDENGNIVGSLNATEQLNQVIKNAEIALKASGANFSNLVRINLYLKDDMMSEQVLERLKEILPDDSFPAITFISGGQARREALMSMDLVAVATEDVAGERVTLYQSEGIFGKPNRSQVAVLAPGRKIFISGQAVPGEDLSDASHQTMRNLFATLAYLGAKAGDVVQVKAFFNPIDSARSVEEIIASFFRGREAPPVISVEWVSDPNRLEIELIASAEAHATTNNQAVSYYAPPWMTQATTFSRVVDIKSGGLFFTSGLYGEGEDDEMQARDIFKTIGIVLEKAGSNYDHLVKATYYPSSEEGRQGFVTVRPEFYNPEKPPAASLIRVQGTGRQDKSINVDLIGAIPE
jgi:enamine deaminase RidA (YjgF/YER057c/UK114 family)